jgi:hypothetical protein
MADGHVAVPAELARTPRGPPLDAFKTSSVSTATHRSLMRVFNTFLDNYIVTFWELRSRSHHSRRTREGFDHHAERLATILAA